MMMMMMMIMIIIIIIIIREYTFQREEWNEYFAFSENNVQSRLTDL